MPSTSPRIRAFTLLELMIAISLGLVILLTAATAFRVASSCVVTSNRLATENTLMRAGFEIALEQLDFWTNLDDPNDATRERLRLSGMNVTGQPWAQAYAAQAPAPATLGLPFSPMQAGGGGTGSFPANVDPFTGTGDGKSMVPRAQPASGPMVPAPLYLPLPLPPATSNTPNPQPTGWENDAGFDPSYVWSANDPRTWFRGNPLEKWLPGIAPNVTPLIFGRYGAFTNITTSPVFDAFTVNGPYPPPATSAPAYSARYDTSHTIYTPHLWYGRQLMGLSRAIGWYGLCDYLPSNTMYGYYTTFSGANGSTFGNTSSAGNLSLFFTFPNWGNGNGGSNQNYLPYPWADPFLTTPVTPAGWATVPGGGAYWNFVGQGMGPTTMGIYALTSTSSYAVSNPYGDSVDKSSIDDNTLAWRCYSYSNTDYSATYNGSTSGAALGMQYFVATTLPLTRILASSPSFWPQVLVGTGHYVKSGHFINLTKIRWISPITGQVSEISFNGIGTSLRGARMQRRPGSAAGWAHWDNDPNASNDPNLDGAQ